MANKYITPFKYTSYKGPAGGNAFVTSVIMGYIQLGSSFFKAGVVVPPDFPGEKPKISVADFHLQDGGQISPNNLDFVQDPNDPSIGWIVFAYERKAKELSLMCFNAAGQAFGQG